MKRVINCLTDDEETNEKGDQCMRRQKETDPRALPDAAAILRLVRGEDARGGCELCLATGATLIFAGCRGCDKYFSPLCTNCIYFDTEHAGQNRGVCWNCALDGKPKGWFGREEFQGELSDRKGFELWNEQELKKSRVLLRKARGDAQFMRRARVLDQIWSAAENSKPVDNSTRRGHEGEEVEGEEVQVEQAPSGEEEVSVADAI